jgi:hypothetical protein
VREKVAPPALVNADEMLSITGTGFDALVTTSVTDAAAML